MKTKAIKLQSIISRCPEQFRDAVLKLKKNEDEVIRVVAPPAEATPEPVMNEDDSKKKRAKLYLSTRQLDRDGDIVMPMGCNAELFKLNPVILVGHQYGTLPVGKCVEIVSDEYGVTVDVEFADTERGEEVWQLVKGGFLRTMSAGFVPDRVVTRNDVEFTTMCDRMESTWKEFTKAQRDSLQRIITSWTLIEGSFAPIPSNPYALVQDVSKGVIKLSSELFKTLNLDSVKPPENKPKPENKPATVKVISTPVIVKTVLTEQSVIDCVNAGVKKTIAQLRGSV